MRIFDSNFHTLENAVDFAVKKNEVIANNIANVDTPNYKTKHVQFKQLLEEQMEQTKINKSHPKHFDIASSVHPYNIHTNNTTSFNHNGNNVDIEKEMADLAENQIYYQSVMDRLNGKFGLLRTVIKGGR